ncbi:hypothetical protein [Streptomyces catenulae]|uniref:DUF11 domain-containing protein n=1 Tax=Streptomyces catenulae TaxID=66875 RepID=A0ABV2YXC9_9ACTN|nr:hypothetical protein [Streptomyces catenulae]
MRTLLLSALLCTAAALPGRAVAAGTPAEPAPPQVAVEVSDGTDRAEAGDRLDYRITVRNLGDAPLRGARIEARLPATTESADAPEGRVTDDHTAVWHADLAPGGLRVLTASAVLGDRPDGPSAAPGTLRAATTVCVHAPGVAAPAACTGDIDDLPETHGAAAGHPWLSWTSWTPWLLVMGLLVGAGLLRRGRRRTAAAAAAATATAATAASTAATVPTVPPAATAPPAPAGPPEPAPSATSAPSAQGATSART